MKSVYIVLLHFKNFYHTDFCLHSISRLTYRNYKVIVVDNNSNNDSFLQIKEKYPDHIYIANDENVGFSRGTNVGIREALQLGADYVYILNNDVEVTPGCIEPMLDVFQRIPSVGLVTNKIMFRGNKQMIWQAGGHIDHKKVMGISRGLSEIDNGQYDIEEETYWASGASSLIKRHIFDKVGLLPEEYFFGQEEWDFSTSSIRAGYKIIYCPTSIVYHEVGSSTVRRPSISIYLGHLNKLIYARKFLSTISFSIFFLKFLFYIFLFFKRKVAAEDETHYYKETCQYASSLAIKDFFKGRYVTATYLEQIEERIQSYYQKKFHS